MKVLVSDSFNCAVLDSACSSTVCGEDWINCYLETLDEEQKQNVKNFKSKTWFKFGDGIKLQSLKKMRIPCEIAGTRCHIETDVVASDIPLLMGKPSMKRAKMTLDMVNDSATIFDRKVKLDSTPSGHYYIPLTFTKSSQYIADVLLTMGDSSEDKKKSMLKLHRQYSHPSARRLKLLLKDANFDDKECFKFIEEISDDCNLCKKYRRTPSRPVTCIPLARDFNEVVAMDLKIWDLKKNIYILHLIDMATRFCVSTIIHKKEKQVIIDQIIEKWIGTGLGCPGKFLSDCGGEFANKDFLDMCENLNICVMNTAAESPFSNGLCERNHAVIDDMVHKILADQPGCSLKIALSWAVHAKNTLHMVEGFSPYQLVFGRNPKLPSVLNDDPPALEGTTTCEVFAKHLNTLVSARKAFLQAESSNRIRRALKHNIRQVENIFENGDNVYYKRESSNEWKGPGRVIGQDGKVVIIKHGLYTIRAHSSRVIKTTYEFSNNNNNSTSGTNKISNDIVIQNEESSTRKQWEYDEDNIEDVTQEKSSSLTHDSHIKERRPSSVSEECSNPRDRSISNTVHLPNKGEIIDYIPFNDDNWRKATILDRAGKATGGNKYWLNIQHSGDEKPFSIDWQNGVKEWKSHDMSEHVSDDLENDVFIVDSRHCEKKVKEAKEFELDQWKKFSVYGRVQDNGQPRISVRWVCNEKFSEDGSSRVKARLVARGFEENVENDFRADSPTASKDVLRIFLSMLATNSWQCNSIDVKAAFLQGSNIDRDVYLKPPKEADDSVGMLWKLKKCVYGLKDASRVWYFTVRSELLKLGCIQLLVDPTMFFWYRNNKMCGLFLMHVDDFIWGGTSEFETFVINRIRSKFEIGKQCSTIFKYIGLEIHQDNTGITLDQKSYIETVNPIILPRNKLSKKNDNLNKDESDQLRCLVGQLNWLCTQTRPDICHEVLELSSALKHPVINDILMANKCLRKVKMEECSIRFPFLGDINNLKLISFSDASHANLSDGYSSGGGYIIFLVNDQGKSCPLSWCSKKIRRVVHSTLAAETLALVQAVDVSYYLSYILSEIMLGKKIDINCYIDNKSLWENVHSTKCVSEKRLRIDLACLKQMLERNELSSIKWVTSSNQLSDCFTKRGVCTRKLLETLEQGCLNLNLI